MRFKPSKRVLKARRHAITLEAFTYEPCYLYMIPYSRLMYFSVLHNETYQLTGSDSEAIRTHAISKASYKSHKLGISLGEGITHCVIAV